MASSADHFHAGRSAMGRESASDASPEIRVGIIGAGAMGRGLVHQCRISPGIRCVAVADVHPERAVNAVGEEGLSAAEAGDESSLHDAIRRGDVAVCGEGVWVARCEDVDVLIEATSAVQAGLNHVLAALGAGHPVVLMNSEVDLAFGPALMAEAARQGVALSSCDGDQHGVIKRLLDEVNDWGFKPLMAGNIKGFLDVQATPETIREEAQKRHLDCRMCAAYTDGTKLGIEMAIVCNATGFRCTQPGMQGPRARHVSEAMELFDLKALATERTGVVDYLLGADPGGGVFLIARENDVYQRRMMHYYKMGPGPFHLFYRPYHLCHVEAMRTVREVHGGFSFLQPRRGFCADVIAYAKRNLPVGAHLDGLGGFDCRGVIENLRPETAPGLPICLADGLVLRTARRRGERIALGDVTPEENRPEWEWFRKARAWRAEDGG